MVDTIAGIFEREGEAFDTSGNSPVLLDGPDNVWCVLSGSVEVFGVQLEAGRIIGAKEHFFSAGQGDLLFGMEIDDFAVAQAFQAVGYPGTRMARLDISRLKELGRLPDFAADIASCIDRWTEGLSKGLTKDIQPAPRPDFLLEPGDTLAADRDRIMYPNVGGIWIQCLEGSGLFLSTEDVAPGDALLPLSRHSWLLALKGAEIKPVTTRDALAQGQVWTSLEAFYARIFQILFLNAGLKAADVYNLMAEKAEQDRREKQDGLVRLASVMHEATVYQADQKFDDLLLSAAAIVGKHLGLAVTAPKPPAEGAVKRKLSLEDVARASHFNIRRVTLPEKWWRQDLGPMVGFGTDDNSPVALVPVSAGGYEMVDPSTGRGTGITAKKAKIIASNAYTFYRAFPDRALTGWDLVRFGLKGSGRDLRWIVLLATAIGLLGLVTPLATGMVFNDIIPNADQARIWGIVGIIAGFAATTILFEITRNIAILRLENRLHYWLEAAVWDRLLRLSTPFFRQYETGDLTTRAMGLGMIRQMVSGPVVTTIIGSLFSCFNLFLLFYYHKTLALVGVGLVCLGGLVIISLSAWQLKHIRRQARIEGEISSRVMQFLSAVTKLRVSGAEDNAFALWARDFSRQKKFTFKGGVVQNFLATFMSIFLLLSQMAIFSWMILKEGGGGMNTGDFLAFNAAFASLNAAMVQVIMALTCFVMAIPYYERIKPILTTFPETDTLKTDPGPLSGKIEIGHIFFRYSPDGPMVLKDISLDVAPGTFVAIVGGSGSGKSTLIRLMLGFEKAESGTIFYDDHDLSDLDVRQVRKNMGVVVQGGNIMAGDIFTNIIGSHPLTLDDAWEAAAMAGLDRDIRDMPMGMHTVIMEGASTLSGGQRQRLMIARAIVNRPRIIIFDEATSALDNRTQAVVSESLSKLKATRIVVAHRLSTIRDADIIHVMDKGELKESGTFEELMAMGGLFKKLAERQII